MFYLVSNLAPSAVGGFVFVVAGASVAPKGRKFVAITLVAINLVVVTLYLAGTWFGVLTFEGEHLWMANLSMFTHLCAAVAAMVAFILDEDWIKV